MARVEPNRRWFGNTRVIGTRELEQFRDAMTEIKNDPYQVVVRRNKLPMSLIAEPSGSVCRPLTTKATEKKKKKEEEEKMKKKKKKKKRRKRRRRRR